MSKSPVKLPKRVDAAFARLDKAVGLLESATANGGAKPTSGDSELAADMKRVQDENVSLRKTNTTVSDRLDKAIGRIRSVLEG